MMIIMFILTFICGLMFGYMMFSSSPRDHKYSVRLNDTEYILKFKTIKTITWNDCDGFGTTGKCEIVELDRDEG